MASVNKVILLGNLGRDPETRYMPSGEAVTNLRIATSEKWKDKAGEAQEKTEWHSVVLFGRVAEVAGEYLKKGASCYFEGKLQTRKWADKEGVEKYSTEIVAHHLQMLGPKREGGAAPESSTSQEYRDKKAGTAGAAPAAGSKRNPTDPNDFDDDIPF